MGMFKKVFYIVISLIIGLSPAYAVNYEPDEKINIAVYEKINPAIVAIDAQLDDGVSAGTGCVISKDGVILTGSHVVEDCKDIDVTEEIKVGQKVLAIGNPFGFYGTLTQGIVSRIDYTKNRIQTDAAINPGCSGGPLLNSAGEVIGINQSIYNPDNNISNIGIGFAIPINDAKQFIKSANLAKN